MNKDIMLKHCFLAFMPHCIRHAYCDVDKMCTQRVECILCAVPVVKAPHVSLLRQMRSLRLADPTDPRLDEVGVDLAGYVVLGGRVGASAGASGEAWIRTSTLSFMIGEDIRQDMDGIVQGNHQHCTRLIAFTDYEV